jgi:Polysaccharide biosynthesis protein.
VVRYLAIELFFLVCFNIFNGIILGLQGFRFSSIISVFGQSFSYFLSFILLYITHSITYAILGLALGYGGSVFIFMLGMIFFLDFSKRRDKNVSLKPVFAYSFPLLLSSIIGYGSSYIDRFVVAYFFKTLSWVYTALSF